MASLVSCENRDRIAIVTIDNPPVNALSQAVRAELLAIVRDLEQNSDITAAVLRCAGRTFVAGADINELGKPPLAPALPEVAEEIESSRVPWVAAIHGTALGGGLELSLACTARVADSKARFGLPEVTLGIIPGAGGTVRLPRLIPVSDAVEIVTGGKPVSVAKALALGLVDRRCETDLLSEAIAFAEDLTAIPKPPILIDRPCRDAEDLDWQSKAEAIKAKARGAAAPIEALEALMDSARLPARDALKQERERFLRLSLSEQAAALRYAFFSERSAGRSLASIDSEPADLARIGVVGGGTMGAGIATALLLSGSEVRLLERDEISAETARSRVREMLDASVARGAVARETADQAFHRLTPSSDVAVLVSCGLVIEAVFEDMNVKRDVFSRLDAIMRPEAVLATNTSYLNVDRLAEMTVDPARVLGLHFFAPAHVMKLLEIVRGQHTGDRALATGAALARRLKKTAVVSGVCHGFIGNRIMAAYRRDCEFMLLEGALPAQIDAAMRDFGFAMGIFEVQDLSGLDIAWAQRKNMESTRDPTAPYCHIADRLCESGRLGRKTKKGWYDYSAGGPVVDREVTRVIEEERARAGVNAHVFSSAEIMQRILGVMQSEGNALLAEGVSENASDIDVVMLTGYGFPRHRGGPMYLAEQEKR
ncbi:3-hydroxyacyl-CoA dehydrogenase NAD-binding domain-containing protein [Agrobacterium sp. LAD9]|uniref:3-hydroxyacyl-CoA dehydrogenase NAD-binding domain-containing protein n=1 Tax=Agrobacterium sp. LAD9 TaxID=2055153 RepID=UPI000D1E939A|nr:3-hydroxyacyl-CoA dehydrogenase NAD-binding domain-containing protein [Agrobacterium sp. LAD9]